MRAMVAMAGAVLALGAGLACAQDAPAPGSQRPGWYVAPMAVYLLPDGSRCGPDASCSVDDGLGLAAALGHRGDFANLELWGQFLSFGYEASGTSGDVRLDGAGIALVAGPFSEDRVLARLFGVIGFGVLLRQDHPNYPEDDTTMFGDAGIGYFHPLQLFGSDMALRTEARYRYEVQQPPHPAGMAHAFGDVVLHVGLQIPLSTVPAPPPPPEPVTVVAAVDGDGDGVPDERDQCPDTPAGATVAENGCAPPPPVAPTLETAHAGDTIVLHGVNFETASATLTANARRLLDAVAQQLAARPELRVEVGGHTDDRGSDAYNQWLSEQRAQSVQAYLVEHGVDAARLGAVGYGETRPVDSNETDEGRERNRRVELKVLE